MEGAGSRDELGRRNGSGIMTVLCIAVSVTSVSHLLYFRIAPWIWSKNLSYKPEDIAPWILRWASESDGVEVYALYLLTLLVASATAALCRFYDHWSGGKINRGLIAISAILGGLLLFRVSFVPPMSNLRIPYPGNIVHALSAFFACSLLTVLLYAVHRRWPKTGAALSALLLVPVCFIATSPVSWIDYSYILAPALRLYYGAHPSEIYFQYDFFLSSLAWLWMKLGLELKSFQLVGQFSYALAIWGAYLYARKAFRQKELAVFLLVALVLTRIYASPYDAAYFFQATPLRLDLWLILLYLVSVYGVSHWSAGLVCGVMILVHKNFGIIYTVAYLQVALSLFALERFDGESHESFGSAIRAFFRAYLAPFAIIVTLSIAGHILYGSGHDNIAGIYRKIGIGFMKIAETSFFWYLFPLLGAYPVLLLRLRHQVSAQYLSAGLCLFFCAVGNSLYFFGRSHENNILNISIPLLLLLFAFLDIISRLLSSAAADGRTHGFWQRQVAVLAGTTVLALILFSYADRIYDKTGSQIRTAASGRFIVYDNAMPETYRRVTSHIRAVTGNSSRLYFATGQDFNFCYYGGYAPVGYFNPFLSWIYMKELNLFLQDLLNSGYFLVFDDSTRGLLGGVRFSRVLNVDGLLIAAL